MMIRTVQFTTLSISIFLAAFCTPASAQESRVWIEGSSTVSSFTCVSEELEGPGILSGSDGPDLEIPVATLDCGSGKMNRDLRSALRADDHPWIRFDVLKIDVESVDATTDVYLLRMEGRLAMAGAERPVEFSLEARPENTGEFRTTGSTPLLLSSFNIDPPTALFGLVRVRDEIVVHLDTVEAADDLAAVLRR